ncbi:MAG: D-alanyl-D-alanine carboxypeptidase [Hyphomicrobiaceae bacterium]|nr:D-alanyl-D-alanine carboxypeptidase [Hyphomicrobiaceae bacterium]
MGRARLFGAVLAFLTLCQATALAGPALLFEATTGKVLYSEDPDNQWHPASLTKIMTAYVTFEAIKEGKITLDSKLVCSEAANKEPPSKIGLPIGAEMSVEFGLKALIVKSANDVAVMLAEAVGGSIEGFVARMNATARKLGMTRTNFTNPNGLPAPDQVTTARDLAKLARAVVRDFPQYAEWWAMPVIQVGKIKLASHNGLLRTFEGADGLKTGFICDSGFNVVASATRDGTRLMAVVLGEPTPNDRSLRAASLLEHGFQHYGWKTFFNATDIDNMPIAETAKGVVSIRTSVLSWDCGHRPRGVLKAQALKSRAARAKARQKRKEKGTTEASAEPPANAGEKTASGAKPAAKAPAADSAKSGEKSNGAPPAKPAAAKKPAPPTTAAAAKTEKPKSINASN